MSQLPRSVENLRLMEGKGLRITRLFVDRWPLAAIWLNIKRCGEGWVV
jgi:hypothetical protein